MAKKFYAVRVGRKTGVFEDWKTAEEQVLKFKGAVFRGFDNLKTAWEFVRASEDVFQKKFGSQIDSSNLVVNSPAADHAIAYTDGSFDKVSQTYAYGVVILWKNQTIKISQRLQDPRDLELQNVAGELAGAMRAMRFAKTNQIKKLTLYHDYQGIAAWAQGKWKTNLPLTQEYQKYAHQISEQVELTFVWVKGHSGDYYNEMVDYLAKTATFKELRKVEKNA